MAQIEASREFHELVRAAVTRYGLDPSTSDILTVFIGCVYEADARRVKEKWREGAIKRLRKSLEALELEQVREARDLADIGAGLGFPGLVLAATLPDTRVSLIEQSPVLCEYLRKSVETMGLTRVEVVEGWVQDWLEGAGRFDVVTSRGVKSVGEMASLASPLLKVGGTLVLWRRGSKTQPADPAALTAGLVPAETLGSHGMKVFAYTKEAAPVPAGRNGAATA
jgi:16S rRNA (guanine(527)-N(7))-methyltransferase RsmG